MTIGSRIAQSSKYFEAPPTSWKNSLLTVWKKDPKS